jgi:hypothetical protein
MVFFDLRSSTQRATDAITGFTDDLMCRLGCPTGYIFNESTKECVKHCDPNHATDKFRTTITITIDGVTSSMAACSSSCPSGQLYYIDTSSGSQEYICNLNCPPTDGSGQVISTFSGLSFIRAATGSTAPLNQNECIVECAYAFLRGNNSQNNSCVPKCNDIMSQAGTPLIRSRLTGNNYECIDSCPTASRRYLFTNSDGDLECSPTCSPTDSNRITGTEAQKFYDTDDNKCLTVCPNSLYEADSLHCKKNCLPLSQYNKRDEGAGELSQDICRKLCPTPSGPLDSKAYFYEKYANTSDANGNTVVIQEKICTMICDKESQLFIYTDQTQIPKQPRCMASCPAEAQYFYLNSNSAKECTPNCSPSQGLFINSNTDKLIFISGQECKSLCPDDKPADILTLTCLQDCSNNGTNLYVDFDMYQGGSDIFKWCLPNCVTNRFFYQVGANVERICTS